MKKILIILILLTTQIFAETKNDNQKIFTAIKGNNVDYISLLIKNKANLSEIFDDESTYNPLDYAIINNKLKIVKLLVEYGLEIEPENDYEDYSSLELAVESNNKDILDYLISKGANINFINAQGKTLLDAAIVKNNYEMIEYLISKGIKMDKEILSSSIYYAIEKNSSLKIIKYLISKGADLRSSSLEGLISPIFQALKNNNYEVLEFLVNDELDIYDLDANENTPLDIAIYNKDYKAINLLLEKIEFANNKSFKSLFTLLMVNDSVSTNLFKEKLKKFIETNKSLLSKTDLCMYASFIGDKTIITELLNDGFNINIIDNYKMNALMWASFSNNIEIVKLLLDKSIDINVQNENGLTALMFSCLNNNKDIVKYLLEKDANYKLLNNYKSSTYEICTFKDSLESLLILLDYNDNIDKKYLLNTASYNGSFNITKYLIKNGVEYSKMEEEDTSPLLLASQQGNFDIVKLLIENGVNINEVDKDGNTSLHYSVENNNKEIFKYLVNYGANLNLKNQIGNTPLMLAIYNYQLDLAKDLINSGADLNIKNEDGWNALMIASSDYTFLPIGEEILGKYSNLEEKTYDGESALMIASTNESTRILNKLIFMGAEIDTVDNDGATPLMWASYHNVLSSLEILLDSKANLEYEDYNGNTALIYATKNNSSEAIDYLIKMGANTKVRNYEGKGLLDLAGSIETRKYLIAKGVKW